MTEEKTTPDKVEEAWDNAISDFSQIESWEKFSSWCGKYAPSLVERVNRYAELGIRDAYLVNRRVREAFKIFRDGYSSFDANLGIATAANSQSFSFDAVTEALCHAEK